LNERRGPIRGPATRPTSGGGPAATSGAGEQRLELQWLRWWCRACSWRAGSGPTTRQRWSRRTWGAGIQPGDLLFERSLPDGSTLRVTATEEPNEIAVAWPGSPDPVIVPLIDGAVTSHVTGDEWTVLALHPCPGDERAHLRAFRTANPALVDEMGVINGVAVVIVPPLVPPSYALLPDTTEVTIETRDADGNLLTSTRMKYDVVASDDDDRRDELADSASPSQPSDIVETDDLPSACEDGP